VERDEAHESTAALASELGYLPGVSWGRGAKVGFEGYREALSARNLPRTRRPPIVKMRVALQALSDATRDDDAPIPGLAVHGENGVQACRDFEKALGEVLDLLIGDEIPRRCLTARAQATADVPASSCSFARRHFAGISVPEGARSRVCGEHAESFFQTEWISPEADQRRGKKFRDGSSIAVSVFRMGDVVNEPAWGWDHGLPNGSRWNLIKGSAASKRKRALADPPNPALGGEVCSSQRISEVGIGSRKSGRRSRRKGGAGNAEGGPGVMRPANKQQENST
jgi:hypothetical protein